MSNKQPLYAALKVQLIALAVAAFRDKTNRAPQPVRRIAEMQQPLLRIVRVTQDAFATLGLPELESTGNDASEVLNAVQEQCMPDGTSPWPPNKLSASLIADFATVLYRQQDTPLVNDDAPQQVKDDTNTPGPGRIAVCTVIAADKVAPGCVPKEADEALIDIMMDVARRVGQLPSQHRSACPHHPDNY